MVKFKGSNSEEKIPAWLMTIQENSWEAELLLSAVLLFGLIQTPIYLDSWTNHLLAWELPQIKVLTEKFIKGLELLRVGFIFHIIVRAMWIAQVGFSYVYPKGIHVESLKFKGRFKRELDNSDSMVKSIMNLEKLASIIFAISFSLFGLLMGFLGYALPYLLMILPLSKENVSEGVKIALIMTMIGYALLSCLIFIDFVTNGIFRRGRKRAMVFYPIAWVFRWLTLSFLYKKTLLTVISNTKGYKRYIISISLVLVVLLNEKPSEFIKNYEVEAYAENTKFGYSQNSNYENKRKADDLLVITIPSDLIEKNVLSIFMKDQSMFSYNRKKNKKDTAEKSDIIITSNGGLSDYKSKDQFLSKIIDISIDSVPYQITDWVNTVHPVTYSKGFITYVNIENLTTDLHRLQVILKGDTIWFTHKTDTLLANIPFYKTN